ncbi:MAG TPA: Glu-tRNA(Gln) amidotransferase subunit GatE [Thermofilum sp.]|nr:Glu-tRNA(Gln) amidotransferase subunit GatE [Thermofilum sp.]
MKIDYKKIGLKCGLEIHQMLNTKTKLFCNCPTLIRQDNPDTEFVRRLRPTRSEMGEMDPAALFEFKKGVKYRYQVYEDSVCLVEMDEEPPHDINPEAIKIGLIIALMLRSMIVDEIQVMRKIVIDGSNTSGFQRTALIALGGKIKVGKKEIPIQTICIEEDASRKVGENREGGEIIYRLDRMGIPLIEIATAPVIETPEEAERVAYKIGQLLRVTGKVKRGLGTIRQDLNISIREGARIEIKGVQELSLISRIVKNEVIRQINLIKIKEELIARNVKPSSLKNEFIDVTDIFLKTSSKIAKRALKKGGVALAVKLPGFAGIIGSEIQPGRRLGTEFADRARYWADVGGIFHSDELPAYGISKEEVQLVKERLGCKEKDGFVLVFEEKTKAEKALNAVIERAREALEGVPEETRGANPDGTTRFLRPMPGKARMYPETDIRPFIVTESLLREIRRSMPELPESKLEKFKHKYGLSDEMAKRMIESYYLDLFEKAVEELKVSASLVASTLENILVNLRREGYPIERLTDEKIFGVFKLLAEGRIAKEAIPDILAFLSKNPDMSPEDSIRKLNLVQLSVEEIKNIVDEVIRENIKEVKARGERAVGLVMGKVMQRVRGRADGKLVSEIVKEMLSAVLSS